ncbi:Gfo/Idh/MocA family oxidoreductase [soil metagenome]
MAKDSKKKAKPFRWGIISTANIGTEKVIPGMLKSKAFEVRAIASRSLPTAKKWAKKLGIPVAHGSYEALLADPEIDAVYNPLPNHLHVPLTLAAAAKGKHVLCEKPIALTAEEAEALKLAPAGILIAEAFMVRHHPQWKKARDLVRKGKIGTLRAVNAVFAYNNTDPNNVRNIADIGGGAAYDIGCYPIVIGRYIFGAEPLRVVSLVDRDPNFRTDRLTSCLMDFGEGRQLVFTVSTQLAGYQKVHIMGTKGRIEVEIPFNAPQGGAMKIYLDSGKKLANGDAKTIKFAKADQYQLQAEDFARAVQAKTKPEFGVDDAILQMRVLDALFRSEKSGGWEKV